MPIDLDVFDAPLARSIHRLRYSYNGTEDWAGTARRVVTHVMADSRVTSDEREAVFQLIKSRKFIPGGRYLYAAGRPVHGVSNCFLFRADDSREGWCDVVSNGMMATMMGGGIGVDYSPVRHKNARIEKTGGVASGPISLMEAVNEVMRPVRNGGSRRAAIWAGLHWMHKDINDFLVAKDWPEHLRELKAKDPEFPLRLEYTNISVIYDRLFFKTMEVAEAGLPEIVPEAVALWRNNCRQAFRTAEPGFAFNFANSNESLRNACTEVVSEDNGDRCNLGTLWLNRFSDLREFSEDVRLSTLFLLCGGAYTQDPTPEIAEVGRRNNRIGLGLGGFWEWLLQNGHDYEVVPGLHRYLEAYRDDSDWAAYHYSRRLDQNEPKGARAIAPNGTIGMLAETTSGIEPALCAAYIRRYYQDDVYVQQKVVDAAAQRLLNRGVSMERIERNDAYSISFEQRVKFQYDVQQYVDMAISSTCNMPAWGTEMNNESTVDGYAATLLRYARGLRGFTCYPDGSRGGQPITKISMSEALDSNGVEAVEHSACAGGTCGS